MANLTPQRLTRAADILERYRSALFTGRKYDTGQFEHELRDLWTVGYQELKGIMIDLAGHGRFQEVAAYYMEHSNAPGVVSEFQRPLTELYGVRSYHHSPDFEEKKAAFWERAFAGV